MKYILFIIFNINFLSGYYYSNEFKKEDVKDKVCQYFSHICRSYFNCGPNFYNNFFRLENDDDPGSDIITLDVVKDFKIYSIDKSDGYIFVEVEFNRKGLYNSKNGFIKKDDLVVKKYKMISDSSNYYFVENFEGPVYIEHLLDKLNQLGPKRKTSLKSNYLKRETDKYIKHFKEVERYFKNSLDAYTNFKKQELYYERNKIFAKYGRKFKTTKLQSYFSNFDWYIININYSDSLLTSWDIEKIKFLKTLENKIKQ